MSVAIASSVGSVELANRYPLLPIRERLPAPIYRCASSGSALAPAQRKAPV